MIIKKLRKGELKFYLGFKPFELAKYAQDYPENTDYVHYFVERYQYDYSRMRWKKIK